MHIKKSLSTFALLFTTFFMINHASAKDVFHGKTLVLVVEAVAENSTLHPSQGAIVQKYDRKKVLIQSFGDDIELTANSRYRITRNRARVLKERFEDNNGNELITKYVFTSKYKGDWTRFTDDNEYLSSGHFYSIPANATDFAPESHDEKTVVLSLLLAKSDVLEEGTYPNQGTVVLQSYQNDLTYTGQGFGPGTVSHEGTFSLKKIAPNTFIEETIQTIPDFNYTAPYVMVYHYDNSFSGTWYQMFVDGLIRFGGNFTTYTTAP
ncbi:hypothetical protein [Aliiglaciecola sp. M165]|uniref:hypothetical protein n=1 Tax=Aliiglaciecola sp. M165 TaxID=2593649 RepID=UPI00117DADC3|nr:hypothetical protein [Aliiglaciecola sp. M165]TRY33056.1 hypothetical protein FM019_03470 [Aliiglaciecola sp. M165]